MGGGHREGNFAQARVGIVDNLVRLSVGIEDLNDLEDDLTRALAAI